jgi:hypothetical protein
LAGYFCYWDADLVVTGRTRDLEENVLQPSFQTGSSSSSPIYFQSFFFIAILYEAFIRNIL